MDIRDSIDDLNIAVCAIAYYLYRLAGCPYGETEQGYVIWLDIQKRAWVKNIAKEDDSKED
jgi:hypothetical protein